jgi:hypothetical protein
VSCSLYSSLTYWPLGLIGGYAFIPVATPGSGLLDAKVNLSLINLGLGTRLVFPIGPQFSILGRASTYYTQAMATGNVNESTLGFSIDAGLGLSLLLSPQFMLQAGATFFTTPSLYNGISVSLNLVTRLTGAGNAAIPRRDYILKDGEYCPEGDTLNF